mgnify:CR=1 FL=1
MALLACMGMGCDKLSTSPAELARHFIESQVAADTPSSEPAPDLAGRVVLDYARALARQGAALNYGVETGTAAADAVSTIVAVTPGRTDGTAVPALRFRVVLRRNDAGDWIVDAWSAAE